MEQIKGLLEIKGLLACGHMPSDHGECSTGTAVTPRGEICWNCALEEERSELLKDQRYFAYLSGDGKHITAWPGGILMTVTAEWTQGVGFGRIRTYLRATDVHGAHWHGTSPGRGMFARMRRAK